jgi:hypothetical protein
MGDPFLARGLSDPRMAEVMAMLSKNPKEALKKYGDQPHLQEFIRRFLGLMGDHLTTEEKATAAAAVAATAEEPLLRARPEKQLYVADRPRDVDPQQMQKWLSDPELRSILNNPDTGRMLADMGRDPRKFKEYAKRPDIQKLLAAGIIQSD